MVSPMKALDVLLALPDPPCTTCTERQRCAHEKIACLDFMRYTKGLAPKAGRPRRPTAFHYQSLFRGEEHESCATTTI